MDDESLNVFFVFRLILPEVICITTTLYTYIVCTRDPLKKTISELINKIETEVDKEETDSDMYIEQHQEEIVHEAAKAVGLLVLRTDLQMHSLFCFLS